MRSRCVPRLLVTGLVAVLVVGSGTAAAQDLEQVEQRLETLRGELEEVTARYERVHDRLDRAEQRSRQLADRAARLRRRAERLDAALASRARSLYKQGAPRFLRTLVAPEGPSTLIQRAGLLTTLQARDRGQLQRATNLRTRLDQTERLLADQRAQLERLRAEVERNHQQLTRRLEEAQRLASRLRSREERRTRVDRGPQQGVYACILDAAASHFRDTWGDPRSGGRGHEGTDVFAAYEAPVYAITAGVISRLSSGGLGGTGVYLRGDDGNVYYYAHLAGYADGLHTGQRVVAGEHIAFNGGSGNASRSAPHVHFELKPGGGAEINPYPWLRAACA